MAQHVRTTVNVTAIVDTSPFTPLHWRAFVLCMACLVMDGFDVQVLGYTAPSIVREYGSKQMRATLIMYSGGGFTGGAAFGGFVATALIPTYGWQSVFYFGGTIPLVIGLVMLAALPESLQFMALRGSNPAKLAQWL